MKKYTLLTILASVFTVVYANGEPDTQKIAVTIDQPKFDDGYNYFTAPVVNFPNSTNKSAYYCTSDSTFGYPTESDTSTDNPSHKIAVYGNYDKAEMSKCKVTEENTDKEIDTYFTMTYSFNFNYRGKPYKCAVNTQFGLAKELWNQSATVGASYEKINCNTEEAIPFSYQIDRGGSASNGGIDIRNDFKSPPYNSASFNLFSSSADIMNISLSSSNVCLDKATTYSWDVPGNLTYQMPDPHSYPDNTCKVNDEKVKVALPTPVVTFFIPNING
ncbi:MAG: hypothetical protein K2X37_10910, partial [Chitinophagaceae bacterium]|nr:hypothetical protein [Chitinophagaceae bacterium]